LLSCDFLASLDPFRHEIPVVAESQFTITQLQAKLEGHVKSGQAELPVRLSSGQVVDSKSAFRNDAKDLLEAKLARIFLECAPRGKAAVEDCEHGRTEQRSIATIDRTVDENAAVVTPSWHQVAPCPLCCQDELFHIVARQVTE
jgi:hypothetical protein